MPGSWKKNIQSYDSEIGGEDGGREAGMGWTYQDHNITLAVEVQIFDKFRQRGKPQRVISEVQELLHVVNVIPLDVLRAATKTCLESLMG